MERQIYNQMIAIEDVHWWFRARRKVAQWMLRKAGLPEGAHILDVGCGSGGNLKLLTEFGHVQACEYDDAMRMQAQARGIAPIQPAHLPESIPYQPGEFDLITLFDVLEHVEEDRQSMTVLSTMLKEEGYVLLTVPAFMFMWSRHDVLHHHKRRYTRESIAALLKDTGFEIKHMNYFNFWLFPMTYLLRKILKASGEERLLSGTPVPPAPLNFLLYHLAACERFFYPFLQLPFGSTLIVLAQKRVQA